MMRKIITIALLLQFIWIGMGNCASGYKNYSWGISIEELSPSSNNDLSTDSVSITDISTIFRITYADYFKTYPMITSIIPMLDDMGHEYQFLNKEDVNFYFDNNHLYAVHFQTEGGASVLGDLLKKYGPRKPLPFMFGAQPFNAYFWNTSEKIILLKKFKLGLETVTYIDKKWFNQIELDYVTKVKNEINASRTKSMNKLD